MENAVLKLRKELGLSQDKFGESLGVTGSGISKIESGQRALTEQMIKAISREYNVNEEWLRSGEGEMFVNFVDEQSELDYLIGRLSPEHDAFKIKFIKFMLKQPDERWDVIEQMIDEYFGVKK